MAMTGAALSLDAWQEVWRELGSSGGSETLHRELLARYSEPHRKYHTLQHLEECLTLFDAVRGKAPARRAGEVAIALWFHDAVYDPMRQDNETRSAEWARQALADAGLASDVCERVAAMITATKHDGVAGDDDTRLLLDIDLSILGAPASRFDEYERQVGEEYAWVPGILFRRTRRKILEMFLARERIYLTEPLFQARESTARENLQRSLANLNG
jgi:predicted metal-dependent HD superfamily phosphohydrolase